MRKWERKNDYTQPWNKFKNKLPCVSSRSRSRWNIILCKHWIYFLNGNKKVWLALTDEQIPWNLYKDYFIMRNITRFVHQQTNYVLDVLLAKLGKSGSLNNHNQLIIKGSFLAKSNNADGQRLIASIVASLLTPVGCRLPFYKSTLILLFSFCRARHNRIEVDAVDRRNRMLL